METNEHASQCNALQSNTASDLYGYSDEGLSSWVWELLGIKALAELYST